MRVANGWQTGLYSGYVLGKLARNYLKLLSGWVAERFKAPVLKTGVPARVPWVRIPPHPLTKVRA